MTPKQRVGAGAKADVATKRARKTVAKNCAETRGVRVSEKRRERAGAGGPEACEGAPRRLALPPLHLHCVDLVDFGTVQDKKGPLTSSMDLKSWGPA